MDERGRIPIPPRFRDAFLQGVILTQGTPDRCVRIYPLAGFEETAASYLSSPETTRLGRLRARTLFSSAFQAELDRQGRILVPPQLRRWAQLDGEVVVAGTGRWFEIWPQADFEEVKRREEAELEAQDSL